MISYDEIRKALGKSEMPDAEVAELPRTLEGFVRVMIEGIVLSDLLRLLHLT